MEQVLTISNYIITIWWAIIIIIAVFIMLYLLMIVVKISKIVGDIYNKYMMFMSIVANPIKFIKSFIIKK